MTMKRDIDVGIVNTITGKYVGFTKDNITQGQNLGDGLFASMSYAGFFPPANKLGSYWFDGSAQRDIDIFAAINRCKDAGFANENIVLDSVMTSAANLNEVDPQNFKSVGMLFRYLEISSYYQSMDNLLRAKFSFPGVNFRYNIMPTGAIPSSSKPLSMSEKDIQKSLDLGVKDA